MRGRSAFKFAMRQTRRDMRNMPISRGFKRNDSNVDDFAKVLTTIILLGLLCFIIWLAYNGGGIVLLVLVFFMWLYL